jgi:hypothetical protein
MPLPDARRADLPIAGRYSPAREQKHRDPMSASRYRADADHGSRFQCSNSASREVGLTTDEKLTGDSPSDKDFPKRVVP